MKILLKKIMINFSCYIFFFFQLFAYSVAENDINYKKLDKYKSAKMEFAYNYFYVDLADFKNEDYLYFKIDVKYGYFLSQAMEFGIFSEIPSGPSTSKIVKFCSENKGKIYSGDMYYSYSYSYKIPKPKDNYIIVSPPYMMVSTILGSMLIKNSELECEGIIPENYYLDGNTGEYNKCYDTCKKCSEPGNSENNNCDECKTNYIFLDEPLINKKNCLKKCDYYYYFNENNKYTCTITKSCPESYKLIEEKKKCVNKCINDKDNKYIYEYNNKCVEQCPSDLKIDNEENKCLESCDEKKFEYENTCLTNCPSGKYETYTDRKICSNEIPQNFYYDNSEKLYKMCYNTCKSCEGPGKEENNNCKECIGNHIFINENLINKKNCMIKCDFNYYFDNNNKYACTEKDSCPLNYKKIKEKKKCVKECSDDIDKKYLYEYNGTCLEKCPTNLKTDNEEKKCLESCYENKYEYENICFINCPSGTYEFFIDRKICILSTTVHSKCGKEKCSTCSIESLNHDLCVSCNEMKSYYPKLNDSHNYGSYIDCYKDPEKYYLNGKIFEPCYESCQTCYKKKENNFHNCKMCDSDYNYIIEYSDFNFNCYKNCNYFYYYDYVKGKYYCTEDKKCPEQYQKLIPDLKECVSNCTKYKEYIYEFRDQCLNDCPIGTEKNHNYCKQICPKEFPFEIKKNSTMCFQLYN